MEFKGASNDLARVYIVDSEDKDAKYPMSGDAGNYLCSLLGSMSILDYARFGNIVVQGRDAVEEDIRLCSNIRVILGVGAGALRSFVDSSKRITEAAGNVYDTEINGKSYKFIPIPSPYYVIKNQSQDIVLKYVKDLYEVVDLVNDSFTDVLGSKKVLNTRSYDEFVSICEREFKDDERLSYDIETNARPIYYNDSRIIGFSLANKNAGVYVDLHSLEVDVDEDEENKIWDYVKSEIFDKKRLIIHNTMYERPYTLFCKDYEIKFEQADDTLVMARLLRGANEGAGLKYQAQKNLNYPDWETDLNRYIDGFKFLVNRIGMGPKKYSDDYEYLKNSKSISRYLDNLCNLHSGEDYDEIYESLKPMVGTYTDLYDSVDEVESKIIDTVVSVVNGGGIQDSTIPYNYIPSKVLSQYGAVDSLATYDLFDYYNGLLDSMSTDKVDLHKGYNNWLQHMYVAYIMERNGMYWDDEVAKKDEEFLRNQALRCLKYLITSPLFNEFAYKIAKDKYKPIILSDYLPYIAEYQGYEVSYDRMQDKFTVKYNGKRVAKSRIDEIVIPAECESDYAKIAMKMLKDDVDKAQSYDELKEFYNPASSTQSDVPRKILLTPRLYEGARIKNLHTLAISRNYEGMIDNLPPVDRKFMQMAELLGDQRHMKEVFGDEWSSKAKGLYDTFVNMRRSMINQVKSPDIRSILVSDNPIEIESFDDLGISMVYNAMSCTGIDPDGTDTWSEEYEWMINFRLYKKSYKLISSYLEGTVGRKSVNVVDKHKLQSGEVVGRGRGYDSNVSEDESYLLSAKWSPNGTATGRWRSAQHTVPFGSQVKKYYGSRFISGTCFAPDYSTLEVRALAAISGDEGMIQLFKDNRDFHRETASKIFRKPPEEITTAERRFSKTGTFSILYGSTYDSFARTYCEGDEDYAKMIYDGFFNAYPKVSEYIESTHNEVMKDHRVSCGIVGRFINISAGDGSFGEINRMKRQAQNAVIQGTASDVVGCVIYDIQKYFEDHNLKSLLIMYVHDSIEMDIYPYELIEVSKAVQFILNDTPMRRFGLPVKADLTMGKTIGHEIGVESFEYNDEMTDAIITLEGYKDEIYETIDNWRSAYKTVEILEEDFKEVYISWNELFTLKKAYTPVLGTHREQGACKVHINYYE